MQGFKLRRSHCSSSLECYAVVPAPWHFLYFLPDPHGQGSFLPTLAAPRTTCCGAVLPFDPAMRACSSSRFLRRWNCASRSSMEVEARLRGGGGAGCWSPSPCAAAAGWVEGASTICMWRSEERRVGQEGRSRGAPRH